jgi:glycerol uptake facilitator-like aquaporin
LLVNASLRQRAAAEALGTGLLLATVVGSGIMGERLAAGNTAVALLANALATGAGLVAYITVLGPISGAHFNPAVSLAARALGRLGSRELGVYVSAQVFGGIAGVFLAHAMFGLPILELSAHVRTGGPQWLAEAVATFGLVTVILGSAARTPLQTPALVGLYIVAAYWFTASTSFANPAVTVARALTDTFAGIRPIDVPGFAVAQIAGALLAAAVSLGFSAPEAR